MRCTSTCSCGVSCRARTATRARLSARFGSAATARSTPCSRCSASESWRSVTSRTVLALQCGDTLVRQRLQPQPCLRRIAYLCPPRLILPQPFRPAEGLQLAQQLVHPPAGGLASPRLVQVLGERHSEAPLQPGTRRVPIHHRGRVAVPRAAAVLHRRAELHARGGLELPPRVEEPRVPRPVALLAVDHKGAAARAQQPPVEVGLVRQRDAQPARRDRHRAPAELPVFPQRLQHGGAHLARAATLHRHAHLHVQLREKSDLRHATPPGLYASPALPEETGGLGRAGAAVRQWHGHPCPLLRRARRLVRARAGTPHNRPCRPQFRGTASTSETSTRCLRVASEPLSSACVRRPRVLHSSRS